MKTLKDFELEKLKELRKITENANGPLGSPHWLVRDDQIHKDYKSFLSQTLKEYRELIKEKVEEFKVSKKDIDRLFDQGFGSEANGLKDRNEFITEMEELMDG